jgi:hypothetical protein
LKKTIYIKIAEVREEKQIFLSRRCGVFFTNNDAGSSNKKALSLFRNSGPKYLSYCAYTMEAARLLPRRSRGQADRAPG